MMSPCKAIRGSHNSDSNLETVPLQLEVVTNNRMTTMVKVLLLLVCCVTGLLFATIWIACNNSISIRELQKDRLAALQSVESLLARVDLMEAALDLEQVMRDERADQLDTAELDALFGHEDEDQDEDPVLTRRKRSPETLRRPSRYMTRPVPIYNRAYGVDFKKNGDGLKLYSTLQSIPDDANSIDAPLEKPDSDEVRVLRPPPASFLKSGDGIRRRRGQRPQVKSLIRHENPTPIGGLVKNDDVLYRESLYKNTPGDDVWDAAVAKVKQSTASPAYLTQAASKPVFVSQPQRRLVGPHKRPRKKNSQRRRHASRSTAAHFNGRPDAAGGDGVWEAAEWMEGLGLTSRYKTGGDHVTVAESGVYLLYAQVKFAIINRAAGFDIKVNNRAEASCSHVSDAYTSSCYTSVVTYLPKNSVVRVQSHTPESPILRLQDGEEATLGLVKLLDAPESQHQLFDA
ncbi:uncharacterized protein LOC108677581 isoform X1 [Hyalella azteca]|uniref:Uncharacterized protein LOC108677581 isoform X1 n=1 Tax=Hyalella azteca TaxID=294128 RepID=A0A8B7P5W4_HYAAZ|nr:uncharacterized protein LOC108677581 isoform X1 [Hyalella azteca]